MRHQHVAMRTTDVPASTLTQMQSILIKPAEGTYAGQIFECGSWGDAYKYLRLIGSEIEEKYIGTCNKTDFTVIFADGAEYRGRFDALHPKDDGAFYDLASHIRVHCQSTFAKPEHKAFLDRYDVGQR